MKPHDPTSRILLATLLAFSLLSPARAEDEEAGPADAPAPAAGAATGLRGTDNSGGGLSGPTTIGSGSKTKKKSTTPKVIERIGE